MKKFGYWFGITLLVLFMVACGSPEGTSSEAEPASEGPAIVDSGQSGENPVATDRNREGVGPNQLLIGAIWLENTDQSITPEQAADLLPLWKAYRSLINSDTAAQVELEAVISQIEGVMTTEQLQAIEAQEINPEDFAAIAETIGFDFASFANQSGGEGGESIVPGQGRGGEGGFMPGQGPGAPQGEFGDLSPDQIATMRAERQAEGGEFGNHMILNLLDPFIEWLEGPLG